MRVCLRCDAGPGYGFGHLMRCVALAQALRRRGEPPATFLVRRMGVEEVYARLVTADGFALQFLDDDEPGLSFDPGRFVTPDLPGLFVFDNYDVTPGQMDAFAQAGHFVAAIDDLADRRLNVRLVLNQNLGAAGLAYDAPGAALLLGPRFVLLREAFLRPRPGEGPGRAPRLFMSFGGGDVFGRVRRLVEMFPRLDPALPGPVAVDLALPDDPAQTARYREALAGCVNFRFRFVVGELDLAEAMASASVALTAGGGSVFELARLGVAQLVVIIDANQRVTAERVETAGLGHLLGEAADIGFEEFSAALLRLLADAPARRAMAARGRALIDGQGADRAAAVLCALRQGEEWTRHAQGDEDGYSRIS
jgi:spore coat polysaccharide biosynthesis predicted glycosyltransferase SpsG